MVTGGAAGKSRPIGNSRNEGSPTKIMGSKVCKVLNAKWHMLCYPVSQTPVISPVFDQNQFVTSPPGGVPVTIEHTTFLCVPSTKTIAGQPHQRRP